MIDYKKIMGNVRDKNPLIHHITNYVTVNDCANVTLAVGASPIMTANTDELEDIINIASAVLINIGTMDKTEADLLAPKIANRLSKTVVLDPVGVGASKKRNELVKELIDKNRFSLIKGNASEIKFLAGLGQNTRGVDVSDEDANTDSKKLANIAKQLSKKLKTIIVITGKEDIIAKDDKAYIIKNGVEEMSTITGSGCMAGSVITSFISANRDNMLDAAATAMAVMGIAGQQAKIISEGTGSFHISFIDKISLMTYRQVEEFIMIESV